MNFNIVDVFKKKKKELTPKFMQFFWVASSLSPLSDQHLIIRGLHAYWAEWLHHMQLNPGTKIAEWEREKT